MHRMIPDSGIIPPMLMPLVAILIGFAVLIWAADRFIVGAGATARNLGFSPLFVGLTVVALGTSAPEILVSAIAAYNGNPGLAIGNALGSNITNVGLVLGAAALVAPLTLRSRTLKREFPVLLGLMAMAWLVLINGTLGRFEGMILVATIVPLLWWMVIIGRTSDVHDPITTEYEAEIPKIGTGRALTWLGVGLALLLASSHAVVWGAVELAELLGVSDTVIGLSIVAIGTSLPELAASVMGAIKKEHDIAVGNVLGSNMFNLLAVLGMPGLIAPGPVPREILARDFPVMGALTIALFLFAYGHRGPPRLGRWAGGLLLFAFVCYQFLLYDKLP